MGRPRKTTDRGAKIAMIKDVAKSYGRTATPLELARKYGTNVSRISAMATQLRAWKVDVARVRNAGIYLEAIAELKKEEPKLTQHVKLTK